MQQSGTSYTDVEAIYPARPELSPWNTNPVLGVRWPRGRGLWPGKAAGPKAAAHGALPVPLRCPSRAPLAYANPHHPDITRGNPTAFKKKINPPRLFWGTGFAQTPGRDPPQAEQPAVPSSRAGSEPKTARPPVPASGQPPPHPPPRPGS